MRNLRYFSASHGFIISLGYKLSGLQVFFQNVMQIWATRKQCNKVPREAVEATSLQVWRSDWIKL